MPFFSAPTLTMTCSQMNVTNLETDVALIK